MKNEIKNQIYFSTFLLMSSKNYFFFISRASGFKSRISFGLVGLSNASQVTSSKQFYDGNKTELQHCQMPSYFQSCSVRSTTIMKDESRSG